MPLLINEIALLAKEYARSHVKKGSTQLETNKYAEVRQLAVASAILDLREEVTSNVNSHASEESLEVETETVKKYSLGNCGEMAKMALYYIITHHPQVYAQVYYIGNGDHAFLIIGKKKPPLTTRLETWDEDAHICDPWSNTVYPVTQWKEKLEDYKYKYTGLSEDTKRFQKLKYKDLKKNGFILQTPDYKKKFFVSRMYDKSGKIIGKTYFFGLSKENYTIPLNNNHFMRPVTDYDSISQYQHGSIYRRDKIKSAIIALRPFKDIFPDTKCFHQLLSERQLLWDHSINENLRPDERLRREELVKQSIAILKNFKRYLQNFNYASNIQGMCALPVLEQQEIDNTIDCLDQLLKSRALQDVALLNNTPIKDDQFSQEVKKILTKYSCPSLKKMAVEGAIRRVDQDVNAFISYFYKVVKPTLQIRRNSTLDRIRGFFSSPVEVKGAKISEQLEELINNYSSQLAKSALKPSR